MNMADWGGGSEVSRRRAGGLFESRDLGLLLLDDEGQVLYHDEQTMAPHKAERAYRSQHGEAASQRSEHMPARVPWFRARHHFGAR